MDVLAFGSKKLIRNWNAYNFNISQQKLLEFDLDVVLDELDFDMNQVS